MNSNIIMEDPLAVIQSGNLELVREWYSLKGRNIGAAYIFNWYCDRPGCTGEIVDFILEKDNDICLRTNLDNNYLHKLILFCCLDDISLPFKQLIRRGVNIEHYNFYGESVLYTAIKNTNMFMRTSRIELVMRHLPPNANVDWRSIKCMLRECKKTISLVAKYQPHWLDHIEVRYKIICEHLKGQQQYDIILCLLDNGVAIHPHVFDMDVYWKFSHFTVAGEGVHSDKQGTMLTMTVRNGTMIAPILSAAKYHKKHELNFPNLGDLMNLQSFCWLIYHVQEKKIFEKRNLTDVLRRVRTFFPNFL